MRHNDTLEFTVSEGEAGLRLDVFLAGAVEDASRSFLKKVIKDGRVRVGGQTVMQPSRTVSVGDTVHVDMPPPAETQLRPEDIPLDILYEDTQVVVVNKPSGMVVHPAPGHAMGTLVNALLHHCPDFRVAELGAAGEESDDETALRPGIVHRLDRFTSGVLVVAKTPEAFRRLAEQAREHSFDRRYLALVEGQFPEESGKITAPIGRSLSDPSRMSVTTVRARDAVTRFRVLERLGPASLVQLELETGRTHQIRVHLRFAGHRVLGDSVYGVADYSQWPVGDKTLQALEALQGQALHAARLGFEHPKSGERMTFEAPLPSDFQRALDALREENAGDKMNKTSSGAPPR